ncbi:hypothetical protein BJ944DRAFT_165086 [Cunninghamella echinulata]|nr:hypothetical protein BJ944DRAFT_165086 [Cunninghamella echinulata]
MKATSYIKQASITRSIFISTHNNIQQQQQRSFHFTKNNNFASPQSWKPGQSGPMHPLMEQLSQNPHIMQQLIDFTAFLQTKGIDPTGKQLNYMQVIKVMQDPEVKEKVQKLAKEMQNAGIQLDMATIAELQKSLGQTPFGQTKKEDDNDDDKKSDDGVMNKVKGFFKK